MKKKLFSLLLILANILAAFSQDATEIVKKADDLM
jgi:hypothetical protein